MVGIYWDIDDSSMMRDIQHCIGGWVDGYKWPIFTEQCETRHRLMIDPQVEVDIHYDIRYVLKYLQQIFPLKSII